MDPAPTPSVDSERRSTSPLRPNRLRLVRTLTGFRLARGSSCKPLHFNPAACTLVEASIAVVVIQPAFAPLSCDFSALLLTLMLQHPCPTRFVFCSDPRRWQVSEPSMAFSGRPCGPASSAARRARSRSPRAGHRRPARARLTLCAVTSAVTAVTAACWRLGGTFSFGPAGGPSTGRGGTCATRAARREGT